MISRDKIELVLEKIKEAKDFWNKLNDHGHDNRLTKLDFCIMGIEFPERWLKDLLKETEDAN